MRYIPFIVIMTSLMTSCSMGSVMDTTTQQSVPIQNSPQGVDVSTAIIGSGDVIIPTDMIGQSNDVRPIISGSSLEDVSDGSGNMQRR